MDGARSLAVLRQRALFPCLFARDNGEPSCDGPRQCITNGYCTHVRLCYRFALISTIFGPSSTCHSVSLCDTARLQMVSERHILEKDASASSSARHPCRTPWNGAHLQIGNVSEVCLFRLARLGLQLVASPVLADIPQPASAPEALSAEYRSSADTVVTHLRTLRRTMAKEKQIMQASIPSR